MSEDQSAQPVHTNTSTFPAPCEASFEALVQDDPELLLRWIASGELDPTLLTTAAEIAGKIPDAKRVAETLIPLLGHARGYVQEGAVYGLATHLEAEGVRAALEQFAQTTTSPGARDAALEVLNVNKVP